MDRTNKRETRQTGMTDERMNALERIREDKKATKSRLMQAIEHGELNTGQGAMMEIDNGQNDDDFIVDENGNPVKYGDDEDESESQEKVPILQTGRIETMIRTMHLGEQKANKGLDTKLVREKKNAINDLMNELDEDDDEEVDKKKKSKRNFKVEEKEDFPEVDYGNFEEVKPIVNKKEEGENNIIQNKISPKKEEEVVKIKRNKIPQQTGSENLKVVEEKIPIKRRVDPSNNFSLSNTGYNTVDTTMVSQQPQYNQPPKQFSSSTITPRSNIKVPTEQDGSLLFYWYEACEEGDKQQNVIFFGKIYDKRTNCFFSTSILVKNLERTVFAIPKKENEDKDPSVMQDAFDDMRRHKFSYIKRTKSKVVEKNYCFELPIDRDTVHKVVKVKYPAEQGFIPEFKMDFFDYIFGKNSSMLENILIKKKIMGPCWLKIKKFINQADNLKLTHSKYEIIVEDIRNLEVEKVYKVAPPLKVLSISTKILQSGNFSELYSIGLVKQQRYEIEGRGIPDKNELEATIFLRDINDKLPVYKDRSTLPIRRLVESKLDSYLYKDTKDHKFKSAVYVKGDEKSLLENFIKYVMDYDPDIIVGHKLYSNHLEMIISRIEHYKLSNWHVIGKLSRKYLNPKAIKKDYLGSQELIHECFMGRLLCDTFLSAKELLLKEVNYDLKTLCENHLKDICKFDEVDSFKFINEIKEDSNMEYFIVNFYREVYYTLLLMDKYQILQLTNKLTTIAGALWTKSLQSSRAARCEMLLMHEYAGKNYLYPDKSKKMTYKEPKEDDNDDDDDEDEEENRKFGKRGKPQYSGGLVLEPTPGLYDNIILVMDFNSLYPTIIQEYNISFETVIRPPTQAFESLKPNAPKKNTNKKKGTKKEKGKANNNDKSEDESEISAIKPNEIKEEDEHEDAAKHVEIKDMIKEGKEKGLLPTILEFLVGKRNEIKKQMKGTKDVFKHALLDIQQKAYKVTANSLYGYLAYINSRFFSKDIAALVTKTGRRILKNAAYIVKKKGYEIIYGDTDSVMVNSRTTELAKALDIGKELRSEISKQYSLLVMDIDAVFKSMLLLRKKKYAGLKYENPFDPKTAIVQEKKGIDIVRRDWCILSRVVGQKILDIILSGEAKDDIISKIFQELKDVAEKLEKGEIPLKDFAVTKQITKELSSYGKNNQMPPHACVAQRLSQKEKRAIRAGEFIPYVICIKDDEKGHKSSLADRAFHPKEVESENLQIDIEYYKENEILPILKRMLAHINEISQANLCEALNVQNKNLYRDKTEKMVEDNNYKIDIVEAKREIKFDVKEGLKVKCFNKSCGKEYSIKNYKTWEECVRSLLSCPFCKNINQENMGYYANTILFRIKQLVFNYYKGQKICPSCSDKNNFFIFRDFCLSCGSTLKPIFSKSMISQEIQFIYKIACPEDRFINGDDVLGKFRKSMDTIRNYVKSVKDSVSYLKIKASEEFDFLYDE